MPWGLRLVAALVWSPPEQELDEKSPPGDDAHSVSEPGQVKDKDPAKPMERDEDEAVYAVTTPDTSQGEVDEEASSATVGDDDDDDSSPSDGIDGDSHDVEDDEEEDEEEEDGGRNLARRYEFLQPRLCLDAFMSLC